MKTMTVIDGACHCGNVRFEFPWPQDEAEIPVRQCGCSFCRKHGGVWTSHRDSSLIAAIGDPERVSAYSFGTKTADFHVCSICGVVPFVTSEIDGRAYAVVNVNAFGDIGAHVLSVSATDFDGEDVGSRLERRQRNWIPRVRLDVTGA